MCRHRRTESADGNAMKKTVLAILLILAAAALAVSLLWVNGFFDRPAAPAEPSDISQEEQIPVEIPEENVETEEPSKPSEWKIPEDDGKEAQQDPSEETDAADVTEENSGASEETALPEEPAVQEDPLAEMLAEMTLEQKVGQMILARYPDTDAQAAALVQETSVSGFVLFAREFNGKNAEQVRAMTAALQEAADVPLILAVDEEGGTVCRVSGNPQLRSSKFSSPQRLYGEGGLDALRADAAEKSALLSDLGLNVNLAPVCDVSTNPADFIYDRSMGLDGQGTAEAVAAIVGAMDKTGAVLKHFPGYGGAVDTHTGAAYDNRTYDTFVDSDFLPFLAGFEAGAQAVMVCHNVVACMDPDRPASLSEEVHRILREELHFDGVAVTDDLAMGAVGGYSDEEAAVQAVKAGNDLLCSSAPKTQYGAILSAVQSGEIPEERIDESVMRILKWKASLGLLESVTEEAD